MAETEVYHHKANFLGYKKSQTAHFTPKEKEEYAKKYWDSMGIDVKLNSSNAFETYTKNRIAGPSYFSEVKMPGSSSTFISALKESQKDSKAVAEAKQNVANTLKETFRKVSEGTEAAKEEFEISFAAMNRLITEEPLSFKPGALASRVQAVQGEAVTAIKAQHKEDKDKLDKLFKEDEAFKGNLKTSLGLDSDGQIENLKKDLLAELDKKQEKELEQFNEVLKKTAENLHAGQNRELHRISWFAHMYENDKVMQESIDRARRKKNPDYIPTSASVGISSDRITFEGLRPEDLDTLRTFSGRNVSYDKKTGKFSIEAPAGYNFIYHFLSRHRGVKDEIASIVAIVSATGAESITMEIRDSDPKKAEELGRIAYEACVAAGYPLNKISVKVNGELKTESYDPKTKQPKPDSKNKLFEGHPKRFEYVQKQAYKIEQQYKALATSIREEQEVTARLKAKMEEIRKTPETAPPSPSAAPAA